MGLMSSPAWTRKEGKNPEGGLNAKGRASYNKGKTKKVRKEILKHQVKLRETNEERVFVRG